jgi:hypothetical protein
MTQRLRPQFPFPPAAYVPGVNKHPGHLFKGLWPPVACFNQDNWQSSDSYFFGFDLYHHGFYWEAHEVWEEIWQICKKEHPQGSLLKSLIFLTGAALKSKMKQGEQTTRMLKRALELWEEIREQSPEKDEIMGISLKGHKVKLENYLSEGKLPEDLI